MIKFEELLERANSESIAVHTPTEEQAKTLLKALDKRGFRWASGINLTDDTRYEDRKQYTCYDFGASNYPYMNKVTYAPLDWYQGDDYTIIEFSEIDFEEE